MTRLPPADVNPSDGPLTSQSNAKNMVGEEWALVGTHHGHSEVACRQDVEDASSCSAPVHASLSAAKLGDRGRPPESRRRSWLACMGEGACTLAADEGDERYGGWPGVENLPFLTESIRIFNDRLTVTRQSCGPFLKSPMRPALSPVFVRPFNQTETSPGRP
jgi:hypothetical protein